MHFEHWWGSSNGLISIDSVSRQEMIRNMSTARLYEGFKWATAIADPVDISFALLVRRLALIFSAMFPIPRRTAFAIDSGLDEGMLLVDNALSSSLSRLAVISEGLLCPWAKSTQFIV